MASQPFNWKQPAGRVLEAALNRALALDDDTRHALRGLDGQRIVLRVQAASGAQPLALQVTVRGERLEVGRVDPDEPDLSVRSTLAGVLSQLPFMRRSDAPPVGKLRIEGDAELARRLQTLASGFDPDWQRPFVSVFGEVFGVQIADAFANALRHASGAATDGAQVLAEYVTEESRDVVPRAELDAFHDDVDALRDAVERLAARVAQLHPDAAS